MLLLRDCCALGLPDARRGLEADCQFTAVGGDHGDRAEVADVGYFRDLLQMAWPSAEALGSRDVAIESWLQPPMTVSWITSDRTTCSLTASIASRSQELSVLAFGFDASFADGGTESGDANLVLPPLQPTTVITAMIVRTTAGRLMSRRRFRGLGMKRGLDRVLLDTV
jgi:hypothetical protein